MTIIGDGRYNIDLQSNVTVQNQTSKKDKTDDTATSYVNIHDKTHKRNIKVRYRGSQRTFKKEHATYLNLFGEDDERSYRDGNSTLNKDKTTYATPTGYQQSSMHAP